METGYLLVNCGTVKKRMFGLFALLISVAALVTWDIGNAIFDCPDVRYTSPKRISVSVTVCPAPVTVIV
ncbi:hypothetical protein D3C74_241260 [compost metagenome]